MGPIWGRQDPGGPHVGPMNFALWGGNTMVINAHPSQSVNSHNSDYCYQYTSEAEEAIQSSVQKTKIQAARYIFLCHSRFSNLNNAKFSHNEQIFFNWRTKFPSVDYVSDIGKLYRNTHAAAQVTQNRNYAMKIFFAPYGRVVWYVINDKKEVIRLWWNAPTRLTK